MSMTSAAVICDGYGNGFSWRSLSQEHILKKKLPNNFVPRTSVMLMILGQ